MSNRKMGTRLFNKMWVFKIIKKKSLFYIVKAIYITTIGLYNERREMLATAKLSQPLLKNFTREALVKVKLDF